jgi:hypothetical protein
MPSDIAPVHGRANAGPFGVGRRHSRRIRLAIVVAACTCGMTLDIIAAPGIAVAPIRARADLPVRAGPVRNWAGYAVRPSEPVRQVSARWTQPSATCDGSPSYASIWIGIDGYGSNSVEQIGSEADCDGWGAQAHGAWYQLYPAPAVAIDLAIAPGDRLRALVTRSRATTTLRLVNRTTGERFVVTRSVPAATGASAEWIVEAPKTCGEPSCPALPLTHVTPVAFRDSSLVTRRATVVLSDRTPGIDRLVSNAADGSSGPSSARAGRFEITWTPLASTASG